MMGWFLTYEAHDACEIGFLMTVVFYEFSLLWFYVGGIGKERGFLVVY